MRHSSLVALIFILSVISANAVTVYKFDFGSGKVAKGYQKVDSKTLYSAGKGFGFDLAAPPVSKKYGDDSIKGDVCFANHGFFFSVDVPEGNYKVKVLLGNPVKSSLTTIRGESRRLFFEKVATRKGEFKEVVFTTNVRNVNIDSSEKVRLKPREKNKLNWDRKLTIEFSDSAPSVCAVEIERVENAITVFLCGNSTVVDQDNEPWAAWGQMIPRFFDENICFANYAESGEAANTFIAAGRLKKIGSIIKPGDYLFVEFGHNDQKQKGPGQGPWTSYTESLKEYIKLARSKGAIPVLVTSMNRRTFDSAGRVTNSLLEYPAAVRKLAADENVALIDLNAMSKVMYEAWGEKGSVKAFVHYPANTFPNQPKALEDDTHFNSYGAYEISKCVIEGIRKALPNLAKHLRKDYSGFDPAKPDSFESFSMPASPFVEIEKPEGN